MKRRYVEHLHRYFLLFVFAVVASLGLGRNAFSQTRNRIDHRGKEFYIAFLPTNGWDDKPLLELIVSCEKPTTITYSYLNNPGRQYNFQIPVANRAYHIQLSDTNDLLLPPPQFDPVTRMSLHLVAQDEITVYGVNTMRWSSDGFLALPDDALGDHHIILSYPNTQKMSPIGDVLGEADFPSQYAVVATKDGTRINITPSCRVNGQPDNRPFSVNLQAGQVFLAQADGSIGMDVTGTEITSNYPVVVYGSHQRTNIPFTEAIGRDHIVEQLPPVNRWGNRLILTPHFQIPKTVADANIARIIAANDNTVVSIDSVVTKTLQARQMMEIPLDRGMLVTATGPILAAQYQHSSLDDRYVRQYNDSIGDPFMMLVMPQEQFDSSYAFESVATRDFVYHYINVVIPTERIGSLRLDGSAYLPTSFTRIPKSSYSYAQIPVSAGAHTITARVPFGLYVYGYGPYNSYGYPGGMVFDTLFKDQKPPLVAIADTCTGTIGAAYDDSTGDFGMESAQLLGSSRNVSMHTYPYKPGVDSIHFRLDLLNPFQDGSADIKVVDTAGLDATAHFPVKGFTVALSADQTAPITLDTLASLNGKRFCTTVSLYNYGKFTQTFPGLLINPVGAGVSLEDSSPITLAPGESRKVTVCFQHAPDTSFIAELSVTNGCLQRLIARLPVASGIDTLPPVITPTGDICQSDVTLDLSDIGTFNSGIESVDVLRHDNADITLPAGPAKKSQIIIHRLDPRQDMIYDLKVKDAVGLTTEISDTVQGFTLEALSTTNTQVGVRVERPLAFDTLVYSQRTCDSMLLYNYGIRTLTLANPRVLGNVAVSIPPEQLPIVLRPGETKAIALCVTPLHIGNTLDTFVVDFYCGSVSELVELQSVVLPLDLSSRDRCGNIIVVSSGGLLKRSFLEDVAPNPVTSGHALVTFGLSQAGPVTLTLHDGLGHVVKQFFAHDALPGGVTQIDAKMDDLSSGMYHLQITYPDGHQETRQVAVSR